jgi:hypothetical protein
MLKVVRCSTGLRMARKICIKKFGGDTGVYSVKEVAAMM